MKIHVLILVIPVLLSMGCKKETPAGPRDPKPVKLSAKASQVIANSNEFGIDLFRETAVADDGNLMLSPLSASTALSMLLNGCGSGTYSQIRDMLGYQDLTMEEINDTYQSLVAQLLTIDPEINLALANSVWYRQGFEVKSPFLERLETAYNARTEALDFNNPSSVNTINGWASDNTNGKIEKVLEEISPDAVMFLMNALYFKGRWTYQFDNLLTSPVRFNPENGDGANVPMMMGNFPYRKYSDNHCTAIELNYGQQNYAMDIIVPNGTLSSYLQDFNHESWLAITGGLDAITTPLSAVIVIPKFKFDYEKYLNDQLHVLGMTDAFNPALADLTGISDEDIFVSFVKQNTFVDVNEEGTEAAAVTTIGIEVTSAPEPFVVDKPFIFAIRERLSNTLLFIGKVEMPVY